MKGVILAGGSGVRLSPLTRVTNKHLLPIYNKPMIHYPLSTLVNAGIEEIVIISGKGHAGHILELLGDGSEFGASLSYAIQEKSGGIAQALGLAKRFSNKHDVAVILGDNIFSDKFDFSDFREGARVYLKEVPDPERFGVAKIHNDKLISIEEKPNIPLSNLAVTGLYLYDSNVFDIINCLKPSLRGELEITDVNNQYIRDRKIDYKIIDGFWSDAGTHDSLYRASTFVRNNIMK
jgi:glucose-1-phosphate thymidylyltransferase